MSSPAEQRTDDATDQQRDQEQVTSYCLGRAGHGVRPRAGLHDRTLREQHCVQPVGGALYAAHLALKHRDLVLQLCDARIGRARVGAHHSRGRLTVVTVVAPTEPAGPAVATAAVQAVVADAPPPQEPTAVAYNGHTDVHRPAVAVDDGVAGAAGLDLVAHSGLLSLVSDSWGSLVQSIIALTTRGTAIYI